MCNGDYECVLIQESHIRSIKGHHSEVPEDTDFINLTTISVSIESYTVLSVIQED